MSELKVFIDVTFDMIRKRVEEEYQHHLTRHFESITTNLDSTNTKFTPKYAELTKETLGDIRPPKPIPGRWWIHTAMSNVSYNNCTVHIYDNFGQPFTTNSGNNLFDPLSNWNFSQHKHEKDPKYQYPLPNSIIDFVKKQGVVNDLYTIGDMYHQILYVFAL